MAQPSPEAIAKLAYRFYLEDGKPKGCAEEHWLRAEAFLSHPENHSPENILTVPSEPEITPALDEKAKTLDDHLPSDPHSGSNAFHQRVNLALDSRKSRQGVKTLEKALNRLPGIERVEIDSAASRMRIDFDARRTNPAAILDAVEEHEEESEFPRD